MIRFGLDDVRGTIIGDCSVVGYLRYGGRQQGGQIIGKTWEDVVEKGKAILDELKREYAGICYDTGEEWEVTNG